MRSSIEVNDRNGFNNRDTSDQMVAMGTLCGINSKINCCIKEST